MKLKKMLPPLELFIMDSTLEIVPSEWESIIVCFVTFSSTCHHAESAHQDEIQRLAFEAMVLKGAVHKYVHSVVGICFASTATNGVPVPPFLIFPMVPGQKSLKELLLHTRRVAGIRDSAAEVTAGSVGRASGKVCAILDMPYT